MGAREYVRPQSTHEIVVFLEGRGLVAHRPDPTDHRKLLIEVTPGKRIVSELKAIRHEWLAASIERVLVPAEREVLVVAAD
jgi:DNA-binding MarR family transcriptional regulator